MQSTCSICNKTFNDKVGMSPMESNLAIRYRNKLGNICESCKCDLRKTRKGRFKLLLWNLKIAVHCAKFLAIFAIPFIALIIALALFVL